MRKAYEICYAVFRVAASIKKEAFAEHLENQGLFLLESFAEKNYGKIFAYSSSLEYLLRIGSDLGIIYPPNSKLIINELKLLNSAIAELSNSAKEVSLENIFSEQRVGQEGGALALTVEKTREGNNTFQNTFIENNLPSSLENNNVTSLENGNGHSVLKAAMRQSAIIDFMRQKGICRLRDLQDIFSGVSERTLRYDMQNLLERGAIERLGNGGPATHYQLRPEELVNSDTGDINQQR